MVMVNHAPISNSLLESQEIPQGAPSFGALINGAGVDMRGWDGVAALVNVPNVTATGTWQAYLQMADDAAFTTNMTPIVDAGTGAAASTPAAMTTTGFFWLEVYRPTRRFVRAVANPLVANITLSVIMLRYKHTGNLPLSARDSLSLTNRVVVRGT
jgi:hypothetical protein